MYKNLKNNNDKFAKGNKHSSLAPVILGLVPRIFWQRVINLVNKLAILLHKYRFTQDSRNKSENDGCWRRWLSAFFTSSRSVIRRRYSLLEVPRRRIYNVIAVAMSIGVAFSNKVMDTHLPLPVGSGDKYDISCFDFKHLLNTICLFFKYPSPDTKVSTSPSGGEVLKLIFCSQCVPDEVAHTPKIPGLRIRRGLFIITLIFKL